MRKIKAVKLTANFQHNLDEIERFLTDTEIPSAFAGLLEELLETLIPNLEQFPELGRPWFDQVRRSLEANAANNALKSQLSKLTSDPSALRLYALRHHVVLYAVIGQTIHLLAIRHHRQLSFDFTQY